jgi:hypothetical protein
MHETDIVDRHRALSKPGLSKTGLSKPGLSRPERASSNPQARCQDQKIAAPFRQLLAQPSFSLSRRGPQVIRPTRNGVASESHRSDRPDPDHGQKAAKSGNFHNVFHKNASHGTSPFDPIMF